MQNRDSYRETPKKDASSTEKKPCPLIPDAILM